MRSLRLAPTYTSVGMSWCLVSTPLVFWPTYVPSANPHPHLLLTLNNTPRYITWQKGYSWHPAQTSSERCSAAVDLVLEYCSYSLPPTEAPQWSPPRCPLVRGVPPGAARWSAATLPLSNSRSYLEPGRACHSSHQGNTYPGGMGVRGITKTRIHKLHQLYQKIYKLIEPKKQDIIRAILWNCQLKPH